MNVYRSYFFLILSIGGLAIVPVYASNGTVVLLILGALGLSQIKPGLTFIHRALATPVGGFFIAYFTWAFLSLIWDNGSLQELWAAFAVLILCIAGLLFMAAISTLDKRQSQIMQTVMIVSCAVMIGLFLFEFFTGGALARYLKGRANPHLDFIGRGGSIMISIIWPVTFLILTRHGKAAWIVAFFIAAGSATYLYPNEVMFLGFLTGGLTFVACLWFRRKAVVLLFSVFVIAILLEPYIFRTIINVPALKERGITISFQFYHRLNILQFVSQKVWERPILGHGFKASRRIGKVQQRAYEALMVKTKKEIARGDWDHLSKLDRKKMVTISHHLLPLHPHNIPMQIWLELGLVGIILYLGIIFGIGWIVWTWRGPPIWAAAVSASTASYLTVSSISFGAWQNWWIATAWLTAGIFVLARKLPKEDR